MKHWIVVLTLLLAAFALVACGSTQKSVVYTIEMSEFAFVPNKIEAQVGQEVTIHLKNVGALNHEFMVGKSVEMMNGMPATFEHNLFEGSEPMVMGGSDDHSMDDAMGMDHGFMVLMERGSDDVSLTFKVTEDLVGEWEIGCFTDGGSHYSQGMTGTLIVRP